MRILYSISSKNQLNLYQVKYSILKKSRIYPTKL